MNARDAEPLAALLETVLYHEPGQREQVERFYGELLGLRQVASWPDGVAYRVGGEAPHGGVLLLFDRGLLAGREGPIAAHGSAGPGHACLVAGEADYEGWRARLTERGVEITHEHEWPSGRRSFYFHDPAGNLLEVADGDLWPR